MAGFLGMDQLGGKKERQAKRAEKKEDRQEKREDRKEKRQDKKEDRKEKRQEKKVIRQTKKATKKTARVEKRADKKEKRIEKREARGGSRLKKVTLAVPRAGFAAVLRLNLFKLASKFAQAYTKDPAAVKKFAARFGYKWTNFASYVNKGAKSSISGDAEFGEVAAATAIASATAIIGAAVVFLKKMGINPEKELSNLIGADPEKFEDDPQTAAADPEPGAEAPPEPPVSGGSNLIPILLLAGGAAFLLMRKK